MVLRNLPSGFPKPVRTSSAVSIGMLPTISSCLLIASSRNGLSNSLGLHARFAHDLAPLVAVALVHVGDLARRPGAFAIAPPLRQRAPAEFRLAHQRVHQA